MKRQGYILTEQTVTKELCIKAILDASKNKKKRGCVKKVLANLDKYAEKIKDIILTGTFTPLPHTICPIVDKASGKRRMLEKPVFYPDQCIHHVAILLIQNRLMTRIDPYCISSIKNRGIIYGYKAIRSWLRKDRIHTKYCFQGDIQKCYESIKPAEILKAFNKFIKDRRYLNLISTIAYSYKSLPLGNYTSSWFCNIILLELDKICRMDPACHYYVRYADDFIILGSNKRKLHKMLLPIIDTFTKIGVKIKPNWQVYPVDVRGIDFIGYRFFRNYTLMRKRTLLTMSRCIRKWKRSYTDPHLARGLLSRIGQLKYVNAEHYKSKHINNLNINKLKEVANRGLCRSFS